MISQGAFSMLLTTSPIPKRMTKDAPERWNVREDATEGQRRSHVHFAPWRREDESSDFCVRFLAPIFGWRLKWGIAADRSASLSCERRWREQPH
jgi:hypothetical protein